MSAWIDGPPDRAGQWVVSTDRPEPDFTVEFFSWRGGPLRSRWVEWYRNIRVNKWPAGWQCRRAPIQLATIDDFEWQLLFFMPKLAT